MKKNKIHYETIEEFKQRLFKEKPGFRKVYEDSQTDFDLTCSIIDARLAKGMTQRKLAEKIGTKQAVISRVEGGANTSVSFLRKMATALNVDLSIKFVPRA
jgi:ribosome-binding protein aMBF1 (putative translation factor)